MYILRSELSSLVQFFGWATGLLPVHVKCSGTCNTFLPFPLPPPYITDKAFSHLGTKCTTAGCSHVWLPRKQIENTIFQRTNLNLRDTLVVMYGYSQVTA